MEITRTAQRESVTPEHPDRIIKWVGIQGPVRLGELVDFLKDYPKPWQDWIIRVHGWENITALELHFEIQEVTLYRC